MQPSSKAELQAQQLRLLPAVDRLLASAELQPLRERLGAKALAELARSVVGQCRAEVLMGAAAPDLAAVLRLLVARATSLLSRRVRRVINGTGVVLHTNLGRAPLSLAAVDALRETSGGYASIELDLETGRRGARGGFADEALAQLSGAEAALVVNNNAAAVLLALSAVARGRTVIVSRGELVEIGGGFRIPEVLERSGARMVEVGTTNRTKLSDYARALDAHPDTAAILRVHQGNFRQLGFVARPQLAGLGKLARERGVLLVKDLGGGALVDLSPLGLKGEPVVRSCVEAGAQLVCFSCDKVLGGPQGGVVVGERRLVDKLRRDPLARAMRLGRLPLVALEATLGAYLTGALDTIPTQEALRRPLAEVRARVDKWVAELTSAGLEVEAVEASAAVGGGALAEQPLPSAALWLRCERPTEVAARLREASPAVMVRVQGERLLVDGRTILPDEDQALLASLISAARG